MTYDDMLDYARVDPEEYKKFDTFDQFEKNVLEKAEKANARAKKKDDRAEAYIRNIKRYLNGQLDTPRLEENRLSKHDTKETIQNYYSPEKELAQLSSLADRGDIKALLNFQLDRPGKIVSSGGTIEEIRQNYIFNSIRQEYISLYNQRDLSGLKDLRSSIPSIRDRAEVIAAIDDRISRLQE